jgi:hypothetical protein
MIHPHTPPHHPSIITSSIAITTQKMNITTPHSIHVTQPSTRRHRLAQRSILDCSVRGVVLLASGEGDRKVLAWGVLVFWWGFGVWGVWNHGRVESKDMRLCVLTCRCSLEVRPQDEVRARPEHLGSSEIRTGRNMPC